MSHPSVERTYSSGKRLTLLMMRQVGMEMATAVRMWMNVWPIMVVAPVLPWYSVWTPWAPFTVARVLQVCRKNALSSLELKGSSLSVCHLTTSYFILSTGYEGDGKTCTQTNICATNNGGCYPLATCSSSPGRVHPPFDYCYTCTCTLPCPPGV